FKCDQVAVDAKDFTNYYNDAAWCDPVYDKLFAKQHVELNHAKRVSLVRQMLTRMSRSAGYIVLDYSPDLQAYRTDRFTGWVHQPAEIGPVLFSNTSPSYANLKPIKPPRAASARTPPAGIAGALLLLASFGLLTGARRAAVAPERS